MRHLKWLACFILLALGFGAGIFYFMGQQKALEFAGGYLIELSLSMDNLFVFITIFTSFRIGKKAQQRVLGYGIAGAIILRFIFIFFGIQLVSMFEWILYVFGGILIINGLRMLRDDEEKDPRDGMMIKVISRILPMSRSLQGDKFIARFGGKLMFTPLFAVLCLIEFSDILFAMDSVPAVFSVSRDLFIIYSSNIFAILGLRQFYFVLEHLHRRFQYVKYGVSVILVFTGMKLAGLAIGWYIPIVESIAVIFGVMFISITASMLISRRERGAA